MKTIIVDYGLGNLFSVYNALKVFGIEAEITSEASGIRQADRLILPGVGAFSDGIRQLRDKNLIEPLRDFAKSGKPFLGICLGMQFLMDRSFEFGEHQGLGLIPGDVVSLNEMQTLTSNLRVPHIGWNALQPKEQRWDGTILQGLTPGVEMYFVHSFHVVPSDPKLQLAQTEYGGHHLCSVVANGNVYGCQFHPEKSANFGLVILKNFINLKT